MTIFLKDMSDEDYDDYLTSAIRDYAQDKVMAGTWEEASALQYAKRDFKELLPKGKETAGEHLFSINNSLKQEKVGYLWFHVDNEEKPSQIFIYDFVIFESFRNLGFGKETLACIDQVAVERGISQINLHVFAHNKRAIHLYKKSGFIATDISMQKRL